jgi:hypothetical protein
MDPTERSKSMTTETTAIVCGHVYRDERPIRVVIRHVDGVWQLVCGAHDHPEDCSDFEPVGLEHLTERQANLAEIIDLKRGWIAEQDESGSWLCKPFEE